MKRELPELLFELDGPNVHPDTVDPVEFLRLAEEFFRLVLRTAESQGRGLTLRGLEIRDKCAAAVVFASNATSARMATKGVGRILRRAERPPSGTEGLVADIRKRLEGLAPGVQANMRLGKDLVAMRSPDEKSAEMPWETTALRVQPLRVSGRGPTVELASDSEALPFVLSLSLDDAQKLGSLLMTRVDVEIRVCRGADGRIVEGRVLKVFELTKDKVVDAWRAWFADVGDWDDISDVRAALGRN